MPVAAVVSFRLGGPDGVSVEATKWAWALGQLGFDIVEVCDARLPGLAIDALEPPTAREVEDALAGADLAVVENLLSLPLNPPASAVVARVLRGRPTIVRHHDLPWQRARFAGHPPPPDDPAWVHVTINDLSRGELAGHGMHATTVRNRFDTDEAPGDRAAGRAAAGVDPGERLLVQPTRAIARKDIPRAVALAEAADATLWIVGPAEEGYGAELDRLIAAARTRVVHRTAITSMADVYAAADAVTFPSTWEGFGNPTVESAIHRRALACGDYPVARELRAYGFEWLPTDDPRPLVELLAAADPGRVEAMLDRNAAVARQYFSLADLPAALDTLIPSGVAR